MYAFPAGFPEDVLDVIATHPHVCRYIDMPVQHCADRVLASMKRGITKESLTTLIDRIRQRVPDIALRTTLIVGYPEEGEREFEELAEFVAETRFDRLGVFSYSQEEGTTAFPLGDPVSSDEKERRRSEIMALQEVVAGEKNRQRIGSVVRIVVDERSATGGTGRTAIDAPEIDNEVTITAGRPLPPGSMHDCQITEAGPHDLVARVVPSVRGKATQQSVKNAR
jgi:ribosomal protein S12 methylthiotransferase